MSRYVVFDTETPNSRNDRMCQIGVSVVENGRITESFVRLVDPECDFAVFNVMLHGITPEATYGSPCFAELWRGELEEVFSDGVLVAHNAPFDMPVLAKCLRGEGVRERERTRHNSTHRASPRALPSLPNHKLDTLSAALGIELDHHDAGSDAEACARIFLASIECGAEPGAFLREYDLLRCSTLKGAVGRG